MEISEIALYNALTKLGLNQDEAKEAVAKVHEILFQRFHISTFQL